MFHTYREAFLRAALSPQTTEEPPGPSMFYSITSAPLTFSCWPMAGGSGTPNTVTPTAKRSSSFTAIPIPDFYMDSCLVAPSDLAYTSSRRTGQAMAFRISIRLVAVSRTIYTISWRWLMRWALISLPCSVLPGAVPLPWHVPGKFRSG